MSTDSHRSIPGNPNPDLGNRGLCPTNRPLPGQPACSFSEEAYKFWSRPDYREGLPDNPEQDKEQKRTQESPGSLYRRAKAEMGRETGRMDPTEPPYSTTTSLREAKGPSNIEKQVAGSGNTKTQQAGLLGPNQETT